MYSTIITIASGNTGKTMTLDRINMIYLFIYLFKSGRLYVGILCACMCSPVRCRSSMTWCRSGMPCPLLYLRWCRGLSLSRSCTSKVRHRNGNCSTVQQPETCYVSSHKSLNHKMTIGQSELLSERSLLSYNFTP